MRLITGLIHTETLQVTHTETGDPDDDGVPTQTTTTTEWKNVNVQQMQSLETDDVVGEYRITRWRCSGPPHNIDGNDTLTWRGDEYEVEGDVQTREGALVIEGTTLTMMKARGAR